jgi:lambda family phage portal protein
MNIFQRIGDAFRRTPKEIETRGLNALASIGSADWPVSGATEDAEMWANSWALVARVRDLFRTNPLYIAYRETLWANLFGSEGIMLRSTVKEQEDRVIHTPEEERAIRYFEDRRNRVLEWCATKEGVEFKRQAFLNVREASGNNGSRKERQATVKVGDPDIYARMRIESAWAEWQRKEFCDVRGTRSYRTIRQLRAISAVRDGDIFIRMIKSPGVNKFGFSLQLINGEFVDRFFNATLDNGNVVRMGIEYAWSPWGLGKVAAYHFIKRQERDWQFGSPGFFGYSKQGASTLHDRVPADEIIHYARAVDADATRPAPWVATTVPKARQLDQYELAEVIAAREQAKKIGYLYSDIVPEGGVDAANLPDPRTCLSGKPAPGQYWGLPFGVKVGQLDPTHPNGNFEAFRKAMLRSNVAGMPGANYSTMANDYEAINFSAGRLQRLDSNELWKVLQEFDIEYAETVIFENWLEMALMSQAIPLPFSKRAKFDSKKFQGRRWSGVDEIKEVTAAALRVANHFSSDQRECADKGLDFEDLLFEQAEANMLKEQFGINPLKTVQDPAAETATPDETDDATEPTPAGTQQANPPKRGRKGKSRLAESEA